MKNCYKKSVILIALLSNVLTPSVIFAAQNNPSEDVKQTIEATGMQVTIEGIDGLIDEGAASIMKKSLGESASTFIATYNSLATTEVSLNNALKAAKDIGNASGVAKYTNQLKILEGQRIAMQARLDDFVKLGVKIETPSGVLKTLPKIAGAVLDVVGVAMTANDAVQAYNNGDMTRYQNKRDETLVSAASTIGLIVAGAGAPITIPAGIAIGIGGALNTASENNLNAYYESKVSEFDLDSKLLGFVSVANIFRPTQSISKDYLKQNIKNELDDYLSSYLKDVDAEIAKMDAENLWSALHLTGAKAKIYDYLVAQHNFIVKFKNNSSEGDIVAFKNRYIGMIADNYYKAMEDSLRQQAENKKIRDALATMNAQNNGTCSLNSYMSVIQQGGNSAIGSPSSNMGCQNNPNQNIDPTNPNNGQRNINYGSSNGVSTQGSSDTVKSNGVSGTAVTLPSVSVGVTLPSGTPPPVNTSNPGRPK